MKTRTTPPAVLHLQRFGPLPPGLPIVWLVCFMPGCNGAREEFDFENRICPKCGNETLVEQFQELEE